MSAKNDVSHNDIIVSQKTDTAQLKKTYLPNYFVHLLCHKGTAQFYLGNKHYKIQQRDIVIWVPAAEITRLKCSLDFKATWMYVAYDLMRKNNPDIGWGIKAYMFSQENPVVHLSAADFKKCLQQFYLLKEKYADTMHNFHKEIVNLHVQIFVMEMWNIFSNEITNRNASNQHASLFERFLHLVEDHCMQQREVEYYAAKLFITAKYLTEICKKNSGKTASEWIENNTTQRLIILLQNTELNFTAITYILNFSSQSFFSRYVKKVLGMSPTEYRNRMAV